MRSHGDPVVNGIAMMSEYPIKVALATVVFACFIGWFNAFFKPGDYYRCAGVAAGLAPAWRWASPALALKIWLSLFS